MPPHTAPICGQCVRKGKLQSLRKSHGGSQTTLSSARRAHSQRPRARLEPSAFRVCAPSAPTDARTRVGGGHTHRHASTNNIPPPKAHLHSPPRACPHGRLIRNRHTTRHTRTEPPQDTTRTYNKPMGRGSPTQGAVLAAQHSPPRAGRPKRVAHVAPRRRPQAPSSRPSSPAPSRPQQETLPRDQTPQKLKGNVASAHVSRAYLKYCHLWHLSSVLPHKLSGQFP